MKSLLYTFFALFMSVSIASAGIVFDGSPGTSAPPSTLGGIAMTAFPLDGRPIGGNVTDVTSPLGGIISFNSNLTHVRIGQGWATWSHGYSGDIYFSYNSTITITLPIPTVAFYLYSESNSFGIYNITAFANDGTNSGPIPVDGNGGAKYFGFYTTGGVDLTTITISCSGGSFAIGEFGIAAGATQDHDIVFTSIKPTQMNMSWTRENGDGSFVVVRDGSPITAAETPVNGTLYMNQNTNFSSAPSIGSGKICYFGTNNSIVLTGLTKLHRYYTQVFAYLGDPTAGTAVFTTTAATGNPKDQRTSRFKHTLMEDETNTYSFDIGDIYPLPTKNDLNFRVTMLANDNLIFEIIDEAGRVLFQSEESYSAGEYVKTIPINLYNSGSYMLRVYSNNDNVLVPFVVER